MTFQVTILGSSAAMPAFDRNQTAQVVNYNDENLFLLDCGEGTQLQIAKYKIKPHKINHIFISHLHGDHWLGLIGLLCSMNMQQRTADLHLYAPYNLLEMLTLHFRYSYTVLRYHIHFHALEDKDHQIIWQDDKLSVTALPMLHSLPCWGFIFEEKPKPKSIIKEKLPADLPIEQILQLKAGEDVPYKEGVLKNEDYTLPPPKPKKYVFCSDTVYNEAILPFIVNTDLLYHEASFEASMQEIAAEKMHSTTHEAALIAQKADVKRLLIGHFSARYREIAPLQKEAQEIFPNTSLAIEGETFEV